MMLRILAVSLSSAFGGDAPPVLMASRLQKAWSVFALKIDIRWLKKNVPSKNIQKFDG